MLYIVAIAWLYVTLMMSITETSVVAGIATFVFYGLLPLTVVLYLLGAPARWRAMQRQRREHRERLRDQAGQTSSGEPPNE
jgi:hypothetical protein